MLQFKQEIKRQLAEIQEQKLNKLEELRMANISYN